MLTAAVLAGDLNLVEPLIKAGADLNGLSAYGDTALHLASFALKDELPAVEMLLEAGADPELQNSDGFTPLTMAAKRRQIEIIRLLLDHGVDINAADGAGRTAINQTLENGAVHSQVIELLERGAKVSDEDFAKYNRIGSKSLRKILADGGPQL